ncbi:MAG TPA: ArsC/Spx/MgsR family protein [Sphaerochaeta sp.]|jgi:arsenate reductase-like glutaredoxin family protein|nr:ArsC/Spx/MgsR family protein [Spirochaetota bacterium]HPX28945.1 ArsC/Spx/MgsR family protein [Sphaerochaeta sp.]HQB54511.1 ArsC/Spx/MgsR family protein [Sphaerochaeta sp.]
MIQIIGTKQCNDTKKAIRFCKEARIAHHFVDLNDRPLSPGELGSILDTYRAEELIDTASKTYKKEGYAYRVYDPLEELREKPALCKTPVIRSRGKTHLGFDEAILRSWGASDA